MNNKMLIERSIHYLDFLCKEIKERCVGSEGNRIATKFFRDILIENGWNVEEQKFDAIDWHDGGASLVVDNISFDVLVSPYSLGCSVNGEIIGVTNIKEIENGNFQDKILFLYGEIAKEQIMPKNFVFYNPEEHQQIVSLIEKGQPKAIICATGRNATLAGGVYPFPMFEDGDFDIPSVYMTEEEGAKLIQYIGNNAILQSSSERIPGIGYNVIGKKGVDDRYKQRIIVTAHIDAKKGSPGAIDNATGVVVLLLLAELLKDYSGMKQIELVAFNGEDYYAVPGQMSYITANNNNFDDVLLNINIDGAAYKIGKSAFSFFELPEEIHKKAIDIVNKSSEIVEGVQWVQGDHSIFLQFGRPAIAVSSQWFIENVDSQDITHTEKDNIEIVDCDKMVLIAEALKDLINEL